MKKLLLILLLLISSSMPAMESASFSHSSRKNIRLREQTTPATPVKRRKLTNPIAQEDDPFYYLFQVRPDLSFDDSLKELITRFQLNPTIAHLVLFNTPSIYLDQITLSSPIKSENTESTNIMTKVNIKKIEETLAFEKCRTVEENSAGRFPCPFPSCDHSSLSHERLVHHYFTHTGEKIYECSICKKTFARPCNIRTHLKTHMPI